LGVHLISQGAPKKAALFYTSWSIDELDVMGRGQYRTSRVQELDGNQYCATFDFGDEVLEQLLARAPAHTRAAVLRTLAHDPETPRCERLPGAIDIGIAAVLGELQQGLHECFVPLLITDVFGLDPAAVIEYLHCGGSAEDDEVSGSTTPQLTDGSTLARALFTTEDVEAIRDYSSQIAKDWWKLTGKQRAICDGCNRIVVRSDGFLVDSNLRCHSCFDPACAPEECLRNLQEDPDYYGEGLLDRAREFAAARRSQQASEALNRAPAIISAGHSRTDCKLAESLNRFPNALSKEMLERGRQHRSLSASVSIWEKRMIREFGPDVAKHLRDIWDTLARQG
jgi:hypothetical protein